MGNRPTRIKILAAYDTGAPTTRKETERFLGYLENSDLSTPKQTKIAKRRLGEWSKWAVDKYLTDETAARLIAVVDLHVVAEDPEEWDGM